MSRGPLSGKQTGKLSRETVLAIRAGCCDRQHLLAWAKKLGMTYYPIYKVAVGETYAKIVERPEPTNVRREFVKRYTTWRIFK